ncbi:DUF3304 domain-containing protein [Rhodanobacter sp. 115]
MNSVKSTWFRTVLGTRKLMLGLLASFAIATTGGCMAHTLTVDVVVFNYTPKALADIWVQDHYVGGFVQEYGPGGTGGGIYCCIEVKPGPTHVRWEYDRSPSDTRPDELFKRDVIGVIPKPHGAYKYLGVHIYPDDHVEFTLSRDIPDEKKEGVH